MICHFTAFHSILFHIFISNTDVYRWPMRDGRASPPTARQLFVRWLQTLFTGVGGLPKMLPLTYSQRRSRAGSVSSQISQKTRSSDWSRVVSRLLKCGDNTSGRTNCLEECASLWAFLLNFMNISAFFSFSPLFTASIRKRKHTVSASCRKCRFNGPSRVPEDGVNAMAGGVTRERCQ